MPTASVIFHSDTWTTAGLGEDIATHLRARGIDATVVSIDDADPAALGQVDYLFLGAWTHGLFVVAQHPDRPWVEFARTLPRLEGPRVALFTTYKLRTGSMFRQMRRALEGTGARVGLELKSRDTHLTDEGRSALDRFLDAPR